MKELLEAGVHFGHQTRRWNPKMKEYIFGERNGIHIIDLQKTLKMFREASRFVSELSGQGRNVLFVGTKRQAQEAVAEEAKRCGAFFVNHRWLGGTLTNWATLQKSIKRLKLLKAMNEDGRIKELSAKDQALVDGGEYVDTSAYEQYEKQEGDFVEGVVEIPAEPAEAAEATVPPDDGEKH